jgi:hypothetical protein
MVTNSLWRPLNIVQEDLSFGRFQLTISTYLSDLSPSVESMLFVIEVEIEKAEPILRICRILMQKIGKLKPPCKFGI